MTFLGLLLYYMELCPEVGLLGKMLLTQTENTGDTVSYNSSKTIFSCRSRMGLG